MQGSGFWVWGLKGFALNYIEPFDEHMMYNALMVELGQLGAGTPVDSYSDAFCPIEFKSAGHQEVHSRVLHGSRKRVLMTAAATQPGELVIMSEGLGEWGPPGRADLDMNNTPSLRTNIGGALIITYTIP